MSKQDHYDLMSAEDKPKRYGGEEDLREDGPVTDLTELVARAIYEHDELGDPPEWEQLFTQAKYDIIINLYQHQAQAALKALADAGYVVVPREPTEEMEDAGADAYHTAKKQREPKHAFPAHWLGPVWQAMVKEFENGD